MQLQQIFSFKELGLSLKQIQKVVGRSNFDQLAALHFHRKSLSQDWEKIGVLMETIDKTIKHIKRKKKMKDKEMFDGFNITLIKSKEGQSYSATDHPEFRKQLDPFHPDLSPFMAEAMEVFADQKLS